MSSAASITWWLVTMYPFERTMTPEPTFGSNPWSSPAGPENELSESWGDGPARREKTLTTEGVTRSRRSGTRSPGARAGAGGAGAAGAGRMGADRGTAWAGAGRRSRQSIATAPKAPKSNSGIRRTAKTFISTPSGETGPGPRAIRSPQTRRDPGGGEVTSEDFRERGKGGWTVLLMDGARMVEVRPLRRAPAPEGVAQGRWEDPESAVQHPIGTRSRTPPRRPVRNGRDRGPVIVTRRTEKRLGSRFLVTFFPVVVLSA